MFVIEPSGVNARLYNLRTASENVGNSNVRIVLSVRMSSGKQVILHA